MNDTVTTTQFNGVTVPLHFRGFHNVRAIFDDLLANHGLGAASQVVVTGNSAGGLAVYYHVDYIQSALPKTQVVAVPDSGFFMAYPTFPQVRDRDCAPGSAPEFRAGETSVRV